MNKYSIDRFEENKVVCENEKGEQFIFEKSRFPNTCNEGDIVIELSSGLFEVCADETSDKKKAIKTKLSSLFKNL